MDIQKIRNKVNAGQFSITDHALIEAFKDGISVNDIISCITNGKIIEEYPDYIPESSEWLRFQIRKRQK